MSAFIVLGSQWGDEGKGKMTDYLAKDVDVVVRFQGGNNAGHTVKVGDKEYKLHIIPSGILYRDKVNVIGNGVVLDPEALFQEMDYLEKIGVHISPENLMVSDRAQLIMPYHKVLDGIKERSRGKKDIGTTGKGIGPCYTDKMERSGIRVCDFIDESIFKEILKENLKIKNDIITKVYGEKALDFDSIYEKYTEYGRKLAPYVKDISVEVYNSIINNKKVLFEGAQGTLLDIDYGTYPYVTSSSTIAGGVCIGAGIGPTLITGAIGVAKAYTTRVGKGPFPTELFDDTGDWIRKNGREYGVTTGRARRCGWLDLVILKTSSRVSGLTNFAITKIDTLGGLEKVKVCTGYKFNGKIIDYVPASLQDLAKCEPIYEEFDGWDESIQDAKTYDDLPENAKKYLDKIAEFTNTKISIVSVGPGRDQTINLNNM
ncbi:adenylosuccinate synthase [Clostridium sp. WILCCON 0269]|uniref:Adenylosuccinate synthetase n=1 Tax=Candidatus Clostridium eludens TaxID=3381663 RepID=A0ABW8SGH9_9CLOT